MLYQKHILPNKLRLLTIPMPGVQSVTVLIAVGVGSRYEDKNISGISHFLEHMAFKGTVKRPSALEISSIIDGIGGEFNAFTSKDHTGYYIKAAVKHLPLLVDVLSDMMLHSKFDREEIEKERGVIIEEINMYEDTPIRKIGDLYENLLYGDTKLGRDISGRKEVIRSVKKEDFISYVDRFYSPANTIVTIAGGIKPISKRKSQNAKPQLKTQNLIGLNTPRGWQAERSEAMTPPMVEETDEIYRLIEKYLGKWKEKEAVPYEKLADGQKASGLLLHYKDTQQAHLCLGVRSYHLTHPNRYKLGVLTAILGGGMSSRLFIQVREKRGLAYYVRSSNEMYQDVGNFVTQAGVDVVRIDDAIKVMLFEYAKIAREQVTQQELVKAKEYLKGRFTLELEDSRNVAGLFASSDLLEGEIRTPEQIMLEVDKVTVADVQKTAQEIFRQNILNLAIIGPYKQSERFENLLTL